MNKRIRELLKEYPNAQIYTFTYYEVVCEDWGYWLGNIKEVYYGSFFKCNDKIFFKFTDAIEYKKEGEYAGKIEEIEGIIILINV